jgi:hypothetical protein
MPSRPLTEEQKEDAKRLRRLYEEWKRKNRPKDSQDEIADSIGMKQSAFSQRIGGTLALNAAAASKFAALIGCSVADFSPSLARQIASIAGRSGVVADVALEASQGTRSVEVKPGNKNNPAWVGHSAAHRELWAVLFSAGPSLPEEACQTLTALIRQLSPRPVAPDVGVMLTPLLSRPRNPISDMTDEEKAALKKAAQEVRKKAIFP